MTPQPATDIPLVLTPEETCRQLKISMATLDRMIKAGRLRCVRLSPKGPRRIPYSAVLALVGETEPAPPVPLPLDTRMNLDFIRKATTP